MLRAVIYARCSTEEESQIDALKKQVEEAKACVQDNGWILLDSYVESRSGTTTKGRTEYNRLYEDLLCDKFDIIVIKSQDRLMRNTKDWYLFVDRMSTEQKRLYMYIERKFYTPDDALITGIKAILAEAGVGMDRIIKTTVFLSDMNNFGAMNEVYATFFGEGGYPARSAVEVARLPKDALVEIEVIAAL